MRGLARHKMQDQQKNDTQPGAAKQGDETKAAATMSDVLGLAGPDVALVISVELRANTKADSECEHNGGECVSGDHADTFLNDSKKWAGLENFKPRPARMV